MLYATSYCHFCYKITQDLDEENGLKLSVMHEKFPGRQVTSIPFCWAGEKKPFLLSVAVHDKHTLQPATAILHRESKKQVRKGWIASASRKCSLWNEISSHCRSYFSQDSGVGCGGLEAETLTQEKTLVVSWVTCNPWLTPTCQACPTKGHTANTTSPAATQLTSSLLSCPWHDTTTEKGPSLQQLMDELVAATHKVCSGLGEQQCPTRQNPCSPNAQHYTKYPISWGWGSRVTEISFTACFQCSPRSLCIPSN